MGESRLGAEAMRPAHLDDAPQPLGVRLARDAEHPLAAREEDGQAHKALIHVALDDARLVDPDGRVASSLRRPVCEGLELLARRCLLVAPRVAEEGVDREVPWETTSPQASAAHSGALSPPKLPAPA